MDSPSQLQVDLSLASRFTTTSPVWILICMQVLIFSQFMQTIAWLKAEFKKKGINYRFISGDMPMKKRAQAIEAFQKVRSFVLKRRLESILNKLIYTTVCNCTDTWLRLSGSTNDCLSIVHSNRSSGHHPDSCLSRLHGTQINNGWFRSKSC